MRQIATERACPRCHEPLYERAGRQWRWRDDLKPGDPRCTLHANNGSVGACEQCGKLMCGMCRTRWQARLLCPACLERALDVREPRPMDVQAHGRQAALALTLGVFAWLLLLLAGVPLLFARAFNPHPWEFLLFGILLLLASVLPALFGVGQGASALRTRGRRMVAATCGLVLCAAHLGLLLGAMLFAMWTT